jgi:hypothetical protein
MLELEKSIGSWLVMVGIFSVFCGDNQVRDAFSVVF